jgi:hypothetical protein
MHICILRFSNARHFCFCHRSCYRYYCPSLITALKPPVLPRTLCAEPSLNDGNNNSDIDKTSLTRKRWQTWKKSCLYFLLPMISPIAALIIVWELTVNLYNDKWDGKVVINVEWTGSKDFERTADIFGSNFRHSLRHTDETKGNSRLYETLKAKAVPLHATEALGGGQRRYSCSFTTSALDGVSGQRHVLATLYPRGKDPRYPLYRCLGDPQSRSGHKARAKILLPLPVIEPRSPGRPTRSQTLHCLSYPGSLYGTVGFYTVFATYHGSRHCAQGLRHFRTY